jgi:hypothetical protein
VATEAAASCEGLGLELNEKRFNFAMKLPALPAPDSAVNLWRELSAQLHVRRNERYRIFCTKP